MAMEIKELFSNNLVNVGSFLADGRTEYNAGDTAFSDLLKLDAKFILRTDEDLKPDFDPRVGDVAFPWRHAELLLQEGTLLLERCLSLRKEVHDLKTKWFLTRLEIDECNALKGVFDFERRANAELTSAADNEKQAQESAKAASVAIKNASDSVAILHSLSWVNKLVTAGKVAAWAGVASDRHSIVGDATRGIVDKLVALHAFDETGIEKEHQYSVAHHRAMGDRDASAHEVNSATARAQASLHNVNARSDAQKAHSEKGLIALEIAYRKAQAFSLPHGELNYSERIEPFRERLNEDFKAAYYRLFPAVHGLNVLYGFNANNSFPQVVNGSCNLDDLVKWCQEANLWWAMFSGRIQLFPISFSIRRLCGDAEFTKGLNENAVWFDLPQKVIEGFSLILLRGVAISVVINGSNGPLNATLTLPKIAGDAPVVYVGGITPLAVRPVPEINASRVLYNRSLVGDEKWCLKIIADGGIPDNSVIDDFNIQLYVAVI